MTCESLNRAIVSKAIRAGAREYLAQPLNGSEVKQALERCIKRRMVYKEKLPAKFGQVVHVIGSKGGVGTTTIAVNLAANLAEATDLVSVALVDMNTVFGEIPLFMDIKPEHHWGEVAKSIHRLDSSFLMNVLVKHDSGVYVLPAPGQLDSNEAATGEVITQFLGFIVMESIKPSASGTSLSHSAILSLTVCLTLLIGSAIPAWSALIEFKCNGCAQTGTVALNEVTGVDYSGTNIVLNEVVISGAPSKNGTYTLTNGVLNFDTSTGANGVITVGGTIEDILSENEGWDITSDYLLSGSFSAFTFIPVGYGIFLFNGSGPDTKHADLYTAVGLTGADWVFATTELGGDWNGTSGTPTTNAGVVNATIPIPSSVLLFGTGLIGLIGISRRQIFGGSLKG